MPPRARKDRPSGQQDDASKSSKTGPALADENEKQPEERPPRTIESGGQLETNTIFPSQPASDYRSSYYAPSWEFPYNPDKLAEGNTYRTYDEMRDDDQIKVALSLKKDMVVNSGWEIECDDENIKELLTNNLEEMYEQDVADLSFDDSLRDICSFYDYGFSLSEVLWKLKDGLYHLKAVRTRPPHSWQFELDPKGSIKSLIQIGETGRKAHNAAHFLHAVYQPEFGNPYGKSDLKAAHTAWKAKKFFVRMFCIYAERFAGPTVVGRYESGAQEEEIQRVLDMIKTIQNSTGLVVPKDMAVDFVQSARDATDAYERGINLFNLSMSRAILMPDLLGTSGAKTDGGSFALGEKQFELFISTIQKDRKSLERKVNLRLIRPLMLANFGDKIKATFRFKPWSKEDVAEYLKLWTDAVARNVYKPGVEEVDHFRRSIKFPTPPLQIQQQPVPGQEQDLPGKEGEEKKDGDKETGNGKPPAGKPQQTAAAPAPAIPAPAAGTGVPAPAPTGKANKPKEEPEDAKAMKRSFSIEAPKNFAFRDLTTYERKVDFAAVQRSLDSSERELSRALGPATKRIISDIMLQIREKRIISRFKPEAINSIEPHFLKDLNFVLRSGFRALFHESLDEARREVLGDDAQMSKAFVEGDLLPEEFERILEAETFSIVGKYKTDLTARAQARLVRGIKDGLPEGELASFIREELEDVSDKWANTLVRTKTTELYNAGRKTLWESDPVMSKIIEAYQYSAILDGRTSDVCRYMDGRIFEKGEFIGRATPPLHFNCRSILVAITKFEDYKDSAKYIAPGQEPSLESLVEKGGGLIAAGRE